jgi:predicted PurR-regulated permease PerM
MIFYLFMLKFAPVKQDDSLNIQLSRAVLSLLLIGIVFTCFYYQSNIIVPILLGLLFAILLRPVVVYLKRKLRLPHTVSVFLSVFIFIICIAAIIFFVSHEVGSFTDDLPMIKKNLRQHVSSIQSWIKNKFNISYYKQSQYLNNATEDTITNSSDLVSSTVGSFTQIVINILLVPIYTFLILLYRRLFMEFLRKKIATQNHPILMNILFEIKTVVRSYIIGLLIEMSFVAVLTAVGFWIIDLKYFIFLGIITALLNLIPYLGILIAGTISIIISLVSSNDLNEVIGVITVNVIVQLIDNNFLVPKIVGSKVSLNALVTLLGVITGGAVAGIAGMFLAIPFIAIIKIIMDNIPELEPWGYLLGDKYPRSAKKGIFKNLKKKMKNSESDLEDKPVSS